MCIQGFGEETWRTEIWEELRTQGGLILNVPSRNRIGTLTGLLWIRISGGLLWTQQWILGFYKIRKISWLVEEVPVYQERWCATKLLKPSVNKGFSLQSCVSIPPMFLASTISPYQSFFPRPILLLVFYVGFNQLFILPVCILPLVLNAHTSSNLFYSLFPHPFWPFLTTVQFFFNNRFPSFA
jgi:hypothetical protein